MPESLQFFTKITVLILMSIIPIRSLGDDQNEMKIEITRDIESILEIEIKNLSNSISPSVNLDSCILTIYQQFDWICQRPSSENGTHFLKNIVDLSELRISEEDGFYAGETGISLMQWSFRTDVANQFLDISEYELNAAYDENLRSKTSEISQKIEVLLNNFGAVSRKEQISCSGEHTVSSYFDVAFFEVNSSDILSVVPLLQQYRRNFCDVN